MWNIEIPVIVFVLLIISVVGNCLTIIWLFLLRRSRKKEYYEYLEEEYGQENNVEKGN